jgi:phenylalanyl-tRNA synthetase alpha subunit
MNMNEINTRKDPIEKKVKNFWGEITRKGRNIILNRTKNIPIDKYRGFAFGMGVERLAMLKYKIEDIRMLFENDIRLLKQFDKLSTLF